jgi:hypothetical protein
VRPARVGLVLAQVGCYRPSLARIAFQENARPGCWRAWQEKSVEDDVWGRPETWTQPRASWRPKTQKAVLHGFGVLAVDGEDFTMVGEG